MPIRTCFFRAHLGSVILAINLVVGQTWLGSTVWYRLSMDPQERLPRAIEHGGPALVAQFFYATVKIL